ncbi:hypothetical protein FRB93_010553 [Tulasnella sp. JGI-2019a]|nr:hypothetical protein FRB93_010553 [Tulasnella sp. JGI-2019a]
MSTLQTMSGPYVYDQYQRPSTMYRWPSSSSNNSPSFTCPPEDRLIVGVGGAVEGSLSTPSTSSTSTKTYPAPHGPVNSQQHPVPSTSSASASHSLDHQHIQHYADPSSSISRPNSFDGHKGRYQSFSSVASSIMSTQAQGHHSADSNPASGQSRPNPGPAPPTSQLYEQLPLRGVQHQHAHQRQQQPQYHQYAQAYSQMTAPSSNDSDFLRFAVPPQPAGVFFAVAGDENGYKKGVSAAGGRVKATPMHRYGNYHPYGQTGRPDHRMAPTSAPVADRGGCVQSQYYHPAHQDTTSPPVQYVQPQQRAGRLAKARIPDAAGASGVDANRQVGMAAEAGGTGICPAQGTQQGSSWYSTSLIPLNANPDPQSAGTTPSTSHRTPGDAHREVMSHSTVQYPQQYAGPLFTNNGTSVGGGDGVQGEGMVATGASTGRQHPTQAVQPASYAAHGYSAADERARGTQRQPIIMNGINGWGNVNGIQNNDAPGIQGPRTQGLDSNASRNERPPPPTTSYETTFPHSSSHQQPLPSPNLPSHPFSHNTNHQPLWQSRPNTSMALYTLPQHTDQLPVPSASSSSSSPVCPTADSTHHRHNYPYHHPVTTETETPPIRSDDGGQTSGDGISRWEAMVPSASSLVESGTTTSGLASSGNLRHTEFSSHSRDPHNPHNGYVDSSGSGVYMKERRERWMQEQAFTIPPSYHQQVQPAVNHVVPAPPPPLTHAQHQAKGVAAASHQNHHQSHIFPPHPSYPSSSYHYPPPSSSSSSVTLPQYSTPYMLEQPQQDSPEAEISASFPPSASISRHAAKSSISSTTSTNTNSSAFGGPIEATSFIATTTSAVSNEDGGQVGLGAARRRGSASSSQDAGNGAPRSRGEEEDDLNMIGDAGLSTAGGPEGGSRIFDCPGCDLTFTRLSALKQHMLSHTGEKPHSCQHCGRRFSLASNLRRHTSTGACKVLKFEAVKENAVGATSSAATRATTPPAPSSASQDSPVQPAAVTSRKEATVVEGPSEITSPKKDRKRKAPADTKPAPRRKRHAHQEPRWIPRTLAGFKNAGMLSSTPPFQFCIYRAKAARSEEDGSDAEDDKLEQFTIPTMPLHPVRPTPSRHRSVRSVASLSDSDESTDHEQALFLGSSLVDDDYEERNSYDPAPEYPYHPASWKGRHAKLPGPGLLPDDELVKHPSVARRWIRFQR